MRDVWDKVVLVYVVNSVSILTWLLSRRPGFDSWQG